jgi:hypothetical protein
MARPSGIARIQQELRNLRGEIENLRKVLAHKEARLNELSIAERVLSSLSNEPEERAPLTTAAAVEETVRLVDATDATVVKPTWSNKRGPKPEGAPTMSVMILTALKEAREDGRKGMEPKDIAAYVAKKWWPSVTINAVGPIVWRMYKQGKLSKRESKYFLPKKDEGSDVDASEPSSTNGAGGGPQGAASHPSPAGSIPDGSTSSLRRKLLSGTALPSGNVPH